MIEAEKGRECVMGEIRGIVRYAVLTDLDSVETVMKNVASYTEDRFGDKFTFQAQTPRLART